MLHFEPHSQPMSRLRSDTQIQEVQAVMDLYKAEHNAEASDGPQTGACTPKEKHLEPDSVTRPVLCNFADRMPVCPQSSLRCSRHV